MSKDDDVLYTLDMRFPCLLAVLFVGFKLWGGVDAVPWWIVLAPLWLPPAAFAVGVLTGTLTFRREDEEDDPC